MYKKILLSTLISLNLFANEIDLNDFFRENKINIICKDNFCSGKNIELNDIKIDDINFKQGNLKFYKYDLECKQDDLECSKLEKIETFLSILKKSLFNDLKINNLRSNNLTVEEINSSSKINIYKSFEDKELNYDFFKNNKINLNIKNLLTKENEFKLYEDMLTMYLKELSSIPKEQWDDDIFNEIEYNLNLLNVLKKYSNLIDKYNYKIEISSIKNEKEDLNNQTISLNINVNSNYKSYKIYFEIELLNLKDIFNKLKYLDNKDFALTLILPNINIKNAKIDIDFTELRSKHKEYLLNDIKYKESFNIVKHHLAQRNIIEEEYKNDLEYVEYIKFINKLFSLENNKYYIEIENPDKMLLINLISKSEEDLDLDSIFDSLNWKFKVE